MRPAFDPRRFFDSSTRSLYEHPLSKGLDPAYAPKPPKVQVRASPKARLLLFRKMAESGLLQPLSPGSFVEEYRNGLFAVPKDSVKDRMVLDGRPANLLDRGQNRWCYGMASAASLAGIVLEPDRVLISSGEDLKDYFYQFVVNQERTCRNVLQGSLSPDEAKFVFGDDFACSQDRVNVGLCSLAMGDCCAVEYAQCSHLGMMLQYQVAKVSELLTMHGAVPRGLLQVGVIVDDLVILEQVLRNQLGADGAPPADVESRTRIARAVKAYASEKLVTNPAKAFLGSSCSSYWGVDVDGDKGLLRCSQKRLWPVITITLRVCSLGVATIGILESLAGSWISLLGVRRRLFSLLDVVFEPLGLYTSSSTVVGMSDALISELLSVAVIGTLAVCNLRAQFANFVVATDASGEAMAAVRAPIHPKVAQEVSRHCLRKGIWSRLLPPGRALLRLHGLLPAEDEVPDEGYRTNPLFEVVARCLLYRETWRRRIRRQQHINVSELHAYLLEEKRIAESQRCCRFLNGMDSQVGLGALVKGRAASPALNRLLQRSMPYAIAGDVYSFPMYFNTASNRADAPTRNACPPPPALPKPQWFDALA